MKKLFPLICLLALFACSEKNTPNSGSDSSTKPHSDFSATKQTPFVVQFTNNSTGAMFYEWDFGDGITSDEANPVHEYSKAGSYIVTLTAMNYSWSAETSKKITITTPTICYVTGVCFERVGKSNKYYKAQLEDSGPYSKKIWVNTNYTKMLDNSECPYNYIFQNKVELTNIAKHNYYTIYVYWSNNTSSNGTQILAQKIYRDSEMYNGYPTAISKYNDARDTKITVYFEWE